MTFLVEFPQNILYTIFVMNKNTFKFEVSFNLNTVDGEKLDRESIQDFRDCLEGFVRTWNGQQGFFYSFGSEYGDRDIDPTAIKVKRVK
jgi:hypothetical protein